MAAQYVLSRSEIDQINDRRERGDMDIEKTKYIDAPSPHHRFSFLQEQIKNATKIRDEPESVKVTKKGQLDDPLKHFTTIHNFFVAAFDEEMLDIDIDSCAKLFILGSVVAEAWGMRSYFPASCPGALQGAVSEQIEGARVKAERVERSSGAHSGRDTSTDQDTSPPASNIPPGDIHGPHSGYPLKGGYEEFYRQELARCEVLLVYISRPLQENDVSTAIDDLRVIGKGIEDSITMCFLTTSLATVFQMAQEACSENEFIKGESLVRELETALVQLWSSFHVNENGVRLPNAPEINPIQLFDRIRRIDPFHGCFHLGESKFSITEDYNPCSPWDRMEHQRTMHLEDAAEAQEVAKAREAARMPEDAARVAEDATRAEAAREQTRTNVEDGSGSGPKMPVDKDTPQLAQNDTNEPIPSPTAQCSNKPKNNRIKEQPLQPVDCAPSNGISYSKWLDAPSAKVPEQLEAIRDATEAIIDESRSRRDKHSKEVGLKVRAERIVRFLRLTRELQDESDDLSLYSPRLFPHAVVLCDEIAQVALGYLAEINAQHARVGSVRLYQDIVDIVDAITKAMAKTSQSSCQGHDVLQLRLGTVCKSWQYMKASLEENRTAAD